MRRSAIKRPCAWPVASPRSRAATTEPAIAFDGTNYLVVWADSRLSTDEDIYATRVNQSGTVLDTSGIQISATAGEQLHPTVAFVGSSYVVAWEDFKVTGGTEA